jgi:hypothetical protein
MLSLNEVVAVSIKLLLLLLSISFAYVVCLASLGCDVLVNVLNTPTLGNR